MAPRLWSIAIALAAACAGESPAPSAAPPEVRYPIVAPFECGDLIVPAVFQRDAVELPLPDRVLTLPQAIAASGARYADGATVFWNKGRDATFDDGGTSRMCHQIETADSSPPPLPFEDSGACPFEGCVYRMWTAAQPATARRERRDDAPVAFEVRAGEPVTAFTGVVVTIVPGIVVFDHATELPAAGGALPMQGGDIAYLLTSQGEGFMKVWAHGRLHADVDVSRLTPRRRPETVWWVQIRNGAGQTGWTRTPERFDGKDAHA